MDTILASVSSLPPPSYQEASSPSLPPPPYTALPSPPPPPYTASLPSSPPSGKKSKRRKRRTHNSSQQQPAGVERPGVSDLRKAIDNWYRCMARVEDAQEHTRRLARSMKVHLTPELAEQWRRAANYEKNTRKSLLAATQEWDSARTHRQQLKDNRKRGGVKKEAETAAMDSETFLGLFCCAVAVLVIIIVAVITGLTFFGKAGPRKAQTQAQPTFDVQVYCHYGFNCSRSIYLSA